MKLSTSPSLLKHQARRIARSEGMPLHAALDRVAASQGFAGWSHLAADFAGQTPAQRLLATLRPGEMVLLAARPGQGKTLLALEMAAEAARIGQSSAFFSLDYTERDIAERLDAIGVDQAELGGRMLCDCSDAICADYIIGQLHAAVPGTLAVIDYLQILDQKRDTPPLASQIASLKRFAEARSLSIITIGQIDRRYDPAAKPLPDWRDIRLPNPLDLSLFARACFMQGSELKVLPAAP